MQVAHVIKEWVNQTLYKKKKKESNRYATQKAQAQAQTDKKLKETLLKLTECDKAQKSIEASIESSERQAREQLRHLKEADNQLALAQVNIRELTKELKPRRLLRLSRQPTTWCKKRLRPTSSLKSQPCAGASTSGLGLPV